MWLVGTVGAGLFAMASMRSVRQTELIASRASPLPQVLKRLFGLVNMTEQFLGKAHALFRGFLDAFGCQLF